MFLNSETKAEALSGLNDKDSDLPDDLDQQEERELEELGIADYPART